MGKDQGKKVGGGEGAAKKEKKGKKKRANFAPIANGHTVALPAGFSFDTHKPIGKKDFKTPNLHLEHKAALFDYKAGKLTALANKYRADAKLDPKDSKVVKKGQKAANSLIGLAAQLKAAGIDIKDLLAKAEAEAAKTPAPAATPAAVETK